MESGRRAPISPHAVCETPLVSRKGAVHDLKPDLVDQKVILDDSARPYAAGPSHAVGISLPIDQKPELAVQVVFGVDGLAVPHADPPQVVSISLPLDQKPELAGSLTSTEAGVAPCGDESLRPCFSRRGRLDGGGALVSCRDSRKRGGLAVPSGIAGTGCHVNLESPAGGRSHVRPPAGNIQGSASLVCRDKRPTGRQCSGRRGAESSAPEGSPRPSRRPFPAEDGLLGPPAGGVPRSRSDTGRRCLGPPDNLHGAVFARELRERAALLERGGRTGCDFVYSFRPEDRCPTSFTQRAW